MIPPFTPDVCASDVKEKILDEGLSKANRDNILEYLSVRKDNSFFPDGCEQ